MTAIEKDGMKHHFTSILVKLNDLMFLAMFNDEFVLKENSPQDRFLPDMFMKVCQIEPTLLLRAIKYEDVSELYNKDPNSLKQEAEKANYDFEGIRVQQKDSNTPDAKE